MDVRFFFKLRGGNRVYITGGGADRDRTDDPLLAKQVLSQLSYSPEGLKGGLAALLDICRITCVGTLGMKEVVLERR